jgi:predicted nucleic acid-binding protein
MGVSRELLVADTSFISVWHAMGAVSQAAAPWPSSTTRRIATAALSVSVVTVAELRAGHLKANWGERRRMHADRWLCRFAQIAVDRPVADAWAVLKDATRRRGWACSENDLWIAATGWARGVPVVTCDRDFLCLPALGVEVVYCPRTPPASRPTG